MRLEDQISELILEVARAADQLTNSDLQGFAEATAKKIIQLMEQPK